MSEGTNNTSKAKLPDDRPGEGDGSFSFRGPADESDQQKQQVVSVDDIALVDKAPKMNDAQKPAQ